MILFNTQSIPFFLSLMILAFSFSANAQEYTAKHQIKVNRNGNTQIKLDYIDQAVDVEIERWASMGKSSTQVVTHLRKVTVNIVASTGSGGPETRYPSGNSLGNLVSANTNIPVSMMCNNNTDPTSKSLIHEFDHSLAYAFGLSYWQNVGPGHQAGGTWNGYNINGTVMQPFTPSPAYQAYCIDAPPPPPPPPPAPAFVMKVDNWGLASDIPVTGKFFSTTHEDIGVYRPSDGVWYLKKFGEFLPQYVYWGLPTDIPVVGEYLGNGYSQVAVWRPSNGVWYILDQRTGAMEFIQFGLQGDIPMPGKYLAGVNKTLPAVYRPSTGTIYVRKPDGGMIAFQWGISTDKPVTGDFLGLGYDQIAQYRAASGHWWLFNINTMSYAGVGHWGLPEDIPLAGRFTSTTSDDLVAYRPSTGTYYSVNFNTGAMNFTRWGISTDKPMVAKISGSSGYDNFLIYRNGQWWLMERPQ